MIFVAIRFRHDFIQKYYSGKHKIKAQLRTLPRNATYTSHAIQNEILHILAQKFVPLFAHKSKKLNTLVYQQMRQDM